VSAPLNETAKIAPAVRMVLDQQNFHTLIDLPFTDPLRVAKALSLPGAKSAPNILRSRLTASGRVEIGET
jgi:hypothetical protein